MREHSITNSPTPPTPATMALSPASKPAKTPRNAGGTVQWVQPYVEVEQGAGDRFVHLRWPSAVRGKAMVTVRCDNPL